MECTYALEEMKHLRKLSVEFAFENGIYGVNRADLIMLEALQPHQNIEMLEIQNYSGPRFPSWLMVENLELLLPKLVNLYMQDCYNCGELPALWQLPSLRSLVLYNLDFVENINGYYDRFMLRSTTPTDKHYFPSLKRLALGTLSDKILKLTLLPPYQPDPLRNLNELTLDSVDDLETVPGDVFRNLPSLQSLCIRNCRNLVSLSTCITHLTSIELHNCPLLDLSNENALQFEVPGNLSTFSVSGLDKLMTLPVWLQHASGTLKLIKIGYCPNFTTIPEWIGGLTALNQLEIRGCPMLTSLPKGMRSLTALQIMRIEGCSLSLEQRCRKEAGEDWPKIAHIPTVIIYN